jgi:hypothetical protein
MPLDGISFFDLRSAVCYLLFHHYQIPLYIRTNTAIIEEDGYLQALA